MLHPLLVILLQPVGWALFGVFSFTQPAILLYVLVFAALLFITTRPAVAKYITPKATATESFHVAVSAVNLGALLAAVLNMVTVTGFPFHTWPEGRLHPYDFHEALPPGFHLGFIGNLVAAVLLFLVIVKLVPVFSKYLSQIRWVKLISFLGVLMTFLMFGETMLRFVD